MHGSPPGFDPSSRWGYGHIGFGPGRFNHGFGHHDHRSAATWAIVAALYVILVLVAVLVASYLMHRRDKRRRPGGPPWMFGPTGPFGGPGGRGRPDAQAILAARYARGELERDEFLKMSEDLRTVAAAEPSTGAGEATPAAPPPPPTSE